MVAKVEERRDVAIGHEPQITTAAAVAAVGSTAGDMGLSPNRHRAGTTVAAGDIDPALIDKVRHDVKG
jgi:hypothetical protein